MGLAIKHGNVGCRRFVSNNCYKTAKSALRDQLVGHILPIFGQIRATEGTPNKKNVRASRQGLAAGRGGSGNSR